MESETCVCVCGCATPKGMIPNEKKTIKQNAKWDDESAQTTNNTFKRIGMTSQAWHK